MRLLCSCTASVESDTLTTSSSERKGPIAATDVIFQTSGSSRSGSRGTLDKCCDDLIGGANAGQTRKDLFERKTMLFGVQACASVFDEHKGNAEASALACGGLDAVVCGDTGEDNGVNATGLELLAWNPLSGNWFGKVEGILDF